MDISQVKLPNGDTYKLKDEWLREEIRKLIGDIDTYKNENEEKSQNK